MFDRIMQFIEATGYGGIVALMFLENIFPPIPSELIMPLAGFEAARGTRSLPLVIAAGSCGSLLGALFWYEVARRVGAARLRTWAGRHGRWLTMKPADVDRAGAWFDRNNARAVLLGRLVPTIRTLVSVPAGLFAMPLPRFLAFTALGTFIWTGLLAGAGYMLADQYRQVSAWMNPVSNIVVALIVLAYVIRLLRWRPD